MTIKEFKKAARKANKIYGWVVLNADCGRYFNISKTEAIWQADNCGTTTIEAHIDNDGDLKIN